jgi:hypothetical protein
MKRILLCLTILLLHSTCWAGDPVSGYGTLIAVEFRVGNKFNHAVGKLEYTGESIDIVGFTEGIGGIGIIATPQVYILLEKTIRLKGVHYIKGRNQYGTIITGHIDFRDELKPKITLLTDGGTLITNTSSEGKDWQRKHIPNIVLGQ